MDQTALFYSRPSHDFRGAGLNVFVGARRQRGGSIFGSLKNFFCLLQRISEEVCLQQALDLLAKLLMIHYRVKILRNRSLNMASRTL